MGAIGWAGNKLRGAAGAARPQNIRAGARSLRRDYLALKAGGQKAALPVKWAANRLRGSNRIEKAA
jgi:hypothetical protein